MAVEAGERGTRASTIVSLGLALAAGLVLLFIGPLRDAFLTVATRFDEEGVVSHPEWLLRPLATAAGILLAYALMRLVFERRAGETLERWTLVGAPPRRLRMAVLAVTGLLVPALFASFAHAVRNPAYFAAYYAEDRLFENLSAALLLAAGALFLAAAGRLRGRAVPARGLLALGLAGAGAATIFLGLEEISYGQRIFGWGTPETMAAANLQAETNIHNYWTHDAQGLALWGVGILLFLGTAASSLLRRTWRHPWTAFLPDQAFLPLAAGTLLLASHAGFHEFLEQVVPLLAVLLACQEFAAAGRAPRDVYHLKGSGGWRAS